MRGPNSYRRDESVGAKWNEMRDYERNISDEGLSVNTSTAAEEPPVKHSSQNLSTKQKFIQFKKQSSRRFFNIKNQLAGKYRRADDDEERRGGDPQGEDRRIEAQGEVSTSPAGANDARVNCGPKSFGAVGRGIKSSKSLQNLEQITKDSWRQVADRTSYFGQNLKHRCSSKVDLNKLAPKMNYDSLQGYDSDEENRPTDDLF